MNVGIIGLGLIGGSFAKAFKENSDAIVFGHDTDKATVSYAWLSEMIDGTLTDENIGECELLIIALYPGDAVNFIKEKAHLINKKTLVIDACGTKRSVCEAGFAAAREHGFTFVGGHPMAGIQFSGIKHSRGDLFKGASMIVIPPAYDDITLFERIKNALVPARFGKLTISDAQKHDKIIAYTSQLAHVVSSAYIKSEGAEVHHGYSAGSYKDMTRVATLNETMWTQLFLENRENLSEELGKLIAELSKYKEALDGNDPDTLKDLLREGRECKAKAEQNI